MLKKTTIIILMLTLSISLVFACDMVAIKGLNNYNLVSASNSDEQNEDIQNLFSYFRALCGNTYETHGFGITFYENYNANTSPGLINNGNGSSMGNYTYSDRRSAAIPGITTNTANNYHPQEDRVVIFGQVSHLYKNIRTVLGHKRQATSGPTGIPNPHPWVYRLDGRSYSFMHNGTLTEADLTIIHNYYNNSLNSYLIDTEIAEFYDLGVDSGKFYAYLLMHIKDNNMDILRGLKVALSNLTGNQHNFILSDGYDLYAYKNSSNHALTVYQRKDRNIAMVTSYNHPTPSTSSYRNAVFGEGTGTQEIPLQNDELIYIPTHGNIVRFQWFTNENYFTMKRYSKRGWNWDSFPVLPDGAPQITTTLDTGYPLATRVDLDTGGYAKINLFSWGTYNGFIDEANQNKGMKILNGHPGGYTTLTGKIRPVSYYQYNFNPNQTYWVTYNLMSSQSLKDALGSNFDKIENVWAENWTYQRMPSNETKDSQLYNPNWNSNRPMEFGKTYIIKVRDNVSPIIGFQWKDSRMPAFGRLNLESKTFTYETKDEYEAIDIVSLSKNPEECVEIGVFAGETCLGAVKVDEFPVQILAYTQEYEGTALTFRALYPNGMISQINPVVQAYDKNSDTFTDKVLIAGQIGHSITILDNEKDYSNTEIPALISTHRVYPNPFNPQTTISFSITEKSPVTIEIYNIKGQKVNSLFDGVLPKGNHFMRWNGTDENNQTVSSGMYFYKLTSQNNQVTGKMLLMK
ncbi:MAG: T9SS type A sorting domain-containing protein [Candidatus Cloacimonetes bacterium]|nr:T9SS type A sorting domain-containing protein [Candidatus Cloacimonadota bacterium]